MKKRIVAAFIADIYQDMVRETEYGVIREAVKYNAKILFFTSFSDNYSNTEYTRLSNYDIGDQAIYMLPDLSKFDGLLSFDSYIPDLFKNTINAIKKECPCPVVTLGDISDHSYNVINDHEISLMELIEHLIEVHHCRELIHVAGNPELSFCRERLDVFNRTLDKHGLDHDDSNVIQGNLWYDCARDVVDNILLKYKNDKDRDLPDAIVCANDYMAIGITDELGKRGIRVPEDVIITGYDDVIQSGFHDPSITTSAQPFEMVGRTGIGVLSKLWSGHEPGHVTTVPGLMRRRQSCGCVARHTYHEDKLQESYAAIITKLGRLSQSGTSLILSVSTFECDEDVFNEIEKNCCRDTGFKDAVLCLMDDWENLHVINSSVDLKERSFNVVCGIYKGQPVKRERLEKGSLLPREMMEDPDAYYLVPIHHMQYFLGYFIVSPDLKDLSQANIKSWFINVSTMLENWRVKRELKVTVKKLENLYVTDMLTGLYNRRGYNLFFPDYYDECKAFGTSLAVFLIDMDNLKMINDSYGHDTGDRCIITIADAMKQAAGNGEICIRSGGDEFVILARDYTAEKSDALIADIRKNISKRCRKEKYGYDINISTGYYIHTPDDDDKDKAGLQEECLKQADRLMYAEKKQHHMMG